MARIGGYRTRIAFLRQVAERNAADEKVATWRDWCTVWAQVRPVAGRDRFWAAQEQSEVHGIIRCRFMPGVVPQMRIRLKTRQLEIVSVRDIRERTQELEIAYREVG